MKNYEFITNLRNNNAARVGAAVLVVAGVVGAGLLIEGSSNSTKHPTNNDPTITQDQNNCNSFVNNHASKNMSIYNMESILPKENITANNAPSVVRRYFEKDALAGDARELAMIQAAVVIPSEKSTINPVTGTPSKYNYLKSEQQVYNAMNGNKKLEEQACQNALQVTVENGNYTDNFALQGQEVTQFVPVRNLEKWIVGYTTRVITVKANTVLSGIEFSAPKGSIGYDPVLIDGNGYLYIAGAMPESSTTSSKTKTNHKSGQTHEKALKKGTSSNNTGSGTKVNPGGPNSEKQPTLISPNKLPAPSKSGGSPEAKPGSNNTPGPGGVSTTTTTEAIKPTTTTTTVVTPTTTPTTTPTASTTTTTTAPVASKGPVTCNINIDPQPGC